MDHLRYPKEWERERTFVPTAATFVAQSVYEDAAAELHALMAEEGGRCQSEHERLFLIAWIARLESIRRTALFSRGGDDTRWVIVRPDRPESWERFRELQETDFIPYNGARNDWVAPQFPIEGRAVDFLLVRFDYTLLEPKDPDRTYRNLETKWRREKEVLRQRRPVVVEIGSEPGSRQSDRELQGKGYIVARFSGPEIVADPMRCALEVDCLISPEGDYSQWRRPKSASRAGS